MSFPLLCLLFLLPQLGAQPRTDANGDPLPEGALARLGTGRFRHVAAAVAFAPDGKTLATAGRFHACSPDGKFLAAGSEDAAVRLWEVATGKEVRQFHGPKTVPFSVAFSPNGKVLVATGGENRSIWLWDVDTGKPLHHLETAYTLER